MMLGKEMLASSSIIGQETTLHIYMPKGYASNGFTATITTTLETKTVELSRTESRDFYVQCLVGEVITFYCSGMTLCLTERDMVNCEIVENYYSGKAKITGLNPYLTWSGL